MTSQLRHRVLWAVAVVLFGCSIAATNGDAQTEELTLQNVVLRLQALEERVSKLEAKLAVEHRADARPKVLPEGHIIELTEPPDKAEVGMNVIVDCAVVEVKFPL